MVGKNAATPYAEQIYQPIQMALLVFKRLLCLQQDFYAEHATKYKIAIHDEIRPIIFPAIGSSFCPTKSEYWFLVSKLGR